MGRIFENAAGSTIGTTLPPPGARARSKRVCKLEAQGLALQASTKGAAWRGIFLEI
jgi:hypothetical protein